MPRVVTGLKWVLVTGAGVDLHDAERAAARRLGALLAREGYGLIAGTWGGVDEEVTRSFVNAIPVDSCAERIIHIENSDDRSFHQIRMGRIIKSSPEVAYAPEAVSAADVGVVISGRKGSKPAMDALIEAGKPVIPLAWLGHDAFETLLDLLVQAGEARSRKRLLLSLVDPACATDRTMSRVLGAVVRSNHEIFVSYHRSDTGPDAGRLANHLAALYGSRRVFIDYNSLEAAAHPPVPG